MFGGKSFICFSIACLAALCYLEFDFLNQPNEPVPTASVGRQLVVCTSTQYISSGSCVDCSSSCLTCTGCADSCTSCPTKKYLSGGDCLDCKTSCAECSNSLTCTACDSGSYIYGEDCSSCDPNCKTCSGSSTYCISCNAEGLRSYEEREVAALDLRS